MLYSNQVSPDSPRRTESTTEAAVAAGHDLSGRPGGVDEASVSFAAAPASAYPSGSFRKKIQIRITQLRFQSAMGQRLNVVFVRKK
jgi:hypothetical protein